MSITVTENLVQQMGELYENGWWPPGGDGIVQSGERVKGENGVKYKVPRSALQSWDRFENFLETKITSGDVQFLKNHRGSLNYFILKKPGQQTIITKRNGRNLAAHNNYRSLSERSIRDVAAVKTALCISVGDPRCVVDIGILKNRLVTSARNYAISHNQLIYAKDHFNNLQNPNARDVNSYLSAVSSYNSARSSYHYAYSDFDNYTIRRADPPPRRRPPAPPPRRRPPAPPPRRTPPPPPPRRGENNPDELDD
ncbi:hypothetical protein BVY03_05155 [bacterium K02(2017)]|nr:hypothetical protein BVY03_05155 [bacterium K02(2017)]